MCNIPNSRLRTPINLVPLSSQRQARLVDELIVISPDTLQITLDLAVILADVLRIPPIAAAVLVREGRLMSLQGDIGAAHDRLPHIIKAVDHMPVMVTWQRDVGLETGVGLHNGEETVQLVGHGGGEDGLVGPLDGGGEIVVLVGVVDPNETHSLLGDMSVVCGRKRGEREGKTYLASRRSIAAGRHR